MVIDFMVHMIAAEWFIAQAVGCYVLHARADGTDLAVPRSGGQPLRSAGALLGLLTVDSDQPAPFLPDDHIAQ